MISDFSGTYHMSKSFCLPLYHDYCLAKYIYYTIMLNIDNINYEYVDNLYYLY